MGFLAAITRGLAGERLTEMAELRAGGALGFTDDGQPVASAGVLGEALARQREVGGVLALHEEDRSLSRGGAMHEGAVSAGLGMPGRPGGERGGDGRARRGAGGCEGGAAALPAPELRGLGARASRRRRRAGCG